MSATNNRLRRPVQFHCRRKPGQLHVWRAQFGQYYTRTASGRVLRLTLVNEPQMQVTERGA